MNQRYDPLHKALEEIRGKAGEYKPRERTPQEVSDTAPYNDNGLLRTLHDAHRELGGPYTEVIID